MHPLFKKLTQEMTFTHDIQENAHLFLTAHQCPKTAEHCMAVGDEARRTAVRFDADPLKAEIAGWLHDISAYFGNIRTPIPATSGQRFGFIRTAFRQIRTPCRVNLSTATL